MAHKYGPGANKIYSSTLNLAEDVGGWWERTQRAGKAPKLADKISVPGVTVSVRNDSGGDWVQGGLVGIGLMLLDEADRFNLKFSGDLFTGVNDTWGVALLPIPYGDFGPVQVEGACIAKVNVRSVDHRRAIPTIGGTALKTVWGNEGARLLFMPGGTGEQLCIVKLRPDEGGVLFLNNSGETIPANGVMLIDDVATSEQLGEYFTVIKADDSYDPLYLVNREVAIPFGAGQLSFGIGDYLIGYHGRVLANIETGFPAKGYRCGPKNGSWAVWANYQGFSCRGSATGTDSDGGTFIFATQDPILNDVTAFYNDSGETIPAYAVMELVDDFDAAGRQHVIKPTTSFQRRYLINNDRTVAAGKPGHGTYMERANNTISSRVLCATSASLGDEYGATPGEWFLSSYRPGFHMLGNAMVTGDYFTARAMQREVTRLEGYLVGGAIGTIASADFTIWKGPVAGGGSDAGWDDIEVWSSACEDVVNSGNDLWGAIQWQDSEWRFEPICCPTGDVS
jgi:hypothetical protein